MAAWTTEPAAYTKPPSPEMLKNRRERDALCNLGTPEAAVAFAELLSRGIDVSNCLDINPHKEVAQRHMSRLLIRPNVGVSASFFAEYALLLSKHTRRSHVFPVVPFEIVKQVRDRLIASLSRKTPEALIPTLETVLRDPINHYWLQLDSPYDIHKRYSTALIRLTAANFDHFTPETQEVLLGKDWGHVRSSLMLPVVRRKARKGDPQALVRWQELDPIAAKAFSRKQVVHPTPQG